MPYEAKFIQSTIINHVTSGSAISDAGFSLATDINTNVDNTTNLYPWAKVTLLLNDLSAAPSAGKTINLYRRGIDVSGTYDEPEPDSDYKGTFVGTFLIDATDPAGTDQPYVLMSVPTLPSKMQFFIQNNLGVTISAAWKLYVTLYTFGPNNPT